MATPLNRGYTITTALSTNAPIRESRFQLGWRGDHYHIYGYYGHKSKASGYQKHKFGDYYYGMSAGVGSGSAREFESSGGSPLWTRGAKNKAYAKFREKALGEQSQLGATFYEWEQSLDLIGSVAISFTRVVNLLSKRGLRKAMRGFQEKRPKNAKETAKFLGSLPKSAADSWLQFWFGWSATAGDIFSAAQVMCQDVPSGKAWGTSGVSHSDTEKWGSPDCQFYEELNRTYIYKVGGEVSISNPNLFLLSQLGLANPASIAFEVLPYSFVLDWLFDVSGFIASFTDFLGVNIELAYTTSFVRYNDYGGNYCTVAYDSGKPKVVGISMLREAGIPRPLPNLEILGNLGSSKTRAASAVSLLIQSLTKIF